MTVLTGQTWDISPILQFDWYEPVYYRKVEPTFPSQTTKEVGHFVGISEHVGHYMTFKILTKDDTIIHCPEIRSAENPNTINKRAQPTPDTDNPTMNHVVKSCIDEPLTGHDTFKENPMFMIDLDDLIGRTFLLPTEDGQTHRARITELIRSHSDDVTSNPAHIQYKCSVNDDQYEDIIAYNKIMEYFEKDEDDPILWKFKRITSHQGPLSQDPPDYKG